MGLRALVTRSGDDAEALADLLRQRGLDVCVEPLLTVKPASEPLDLYLDDVQAVLLTSANGARAFAGCTEDRSIPLFAVGDATARTARELGFESVESADGDVSSLAALVAERLDAGGGDLLHVAGSVTAGDLGGDLTARGYVVHKVRLYESVTASALSDAAAGLLRAGEIDLALFYSPRTAATFAALLAEAGLENSVADATAYCLSEAVRGKLEGISWRRVRVAAHPDQDSLLALVDEDLAHGGDRSRGGNDMKDQNDSDAVNLADGLVEPPPGEEAEKRGDGGRGGRGGGGVKALLVLLLLAAAAAGGGYVTLPLWRDRVPEAYRGFLPVFPQEDQRLARLDAATEALRRGVAAVDARNGGLMDAVARLEQRLAVLEQAPPPAGEKAGEGPAPASLPASLPTDVLSRAETEARIAAVADRLDAVVKGQIGAAAIAAVHERLAAIEDMAHKLAARHDSSTALVLAVAQLREAVNRGSPFEAELQALLVLSPDPVAVARTVAGFAAHASKGLTPRTALERRFEALSVAVAQATVVPGGFGESLGEGGDWIDKTLQRLAGLVTLRRTDGQAMGDSTMAVMARADARLQAGDLAGTVAEMGGLTGAPARVAAPWQEEARAWVAAEQALSTLTAEALGRTVATKSGG